MRLRRTAQRVTGAATSQPPKNGHARGACLPGLPPEMPAFPASEETLKEFLKLHRGAHVARDLELAGHVGGGRVLLAGNDLLEVLLGGRNRAVRVAVTLADGHGSALNRHEPLAGAVNVEQIAVLHLAELGCIRARRQVFEEVPG